MKNMIQKMREDKGFTLAELLIVVAIIAVLVAIAIPVFSAQLEKSRESTDAANLRAAYAEVVTAGLTEDTANYSKTVKATQTKSGLSNTSIKKIGSIENVSSLFTTTSGSSWTVKYDSSTESVSIS